MKKYLLCLFASFSFSFASQAGGTKEIHQHLAKDIGDHLVPKIALSVFRDGMDGVNLHVDLAHYTLNAPDTKLPIEACSRAQLQGHAHVFVNGEKVQRLYGQDMHIPQVWLNEGVNQIAVSLNSHEHENWTTDDKPIMSSVFIDLSTDQLVLHHYTSQPLMTEAQHHHH